MELKDYLIPLRKWWWLIVAATLVATVSSYLATIDQPLIYRTTATVLVGGSIENPVPNGDSYLAEQIANTYADIIRRNPIRVATLAALGLTSLPDYTSRQIPNTRLLEVTVTDTDPVRAQLVANELVNQLVRLSSAGQGQDNQQQAFLAGELSDLQVGIRETKTEIAKQRAELAGMFSARQIADAQAQIAGLQSKLSSLQDSYATLLSNSRQEATNVVNVIEAAELPDSPIGPGRISTILLAAAIGFILAAGAAYLLEYLNDTLENPDDVRKVMDLTTLGAVPLAKSADGNMPLLMLADGQSHAAEAYRVLRTNLQFAAVGRPLCTLMVTSSAPGEGKTFTTANLGAALAQTGKQVVLVDADLRRPALHKLFGLRNNVGLSTALLEEKPVVDGLLQATAIPGLRVLTTGPLPPNPAELLGSGRMRELIGALSAQADIVIFDSPPVMALADAAIVGSQVDGVLIVVNAGVTRHEMARRAMIALRRVDVHFVGALLNRMPLKQSDYHYYSHYGYGYRDGASGDGRQGSSSQRGDPARSRGFSRRAHKEPPASPLGNQQAEG
jgi:polysaccharide biosynthesis transport protein